MADIATSRPSYYGGPDGAEYRGRFVQRTSPSTWRVTRSGLTSTVVGAIVTELQDKAAALRAAAADLVGQADDVDACADHMLEVLHG